MGPHNWNIGPLFRSLYEDPRWAALLEKAGLAPHHLEVYRIEDRFPGPGNVPAE